MPDSDQLRSSPAATATRSLLVGDGGADTASRSYFIAHHLEASVRSDDVANHQQNQLLEALP